MKKHMGKVDTRKSAKPAPAKVASVDVVKARDALRPPKPLEASLKVLKEPPIKAWSLSTLSQYESCPLQVRLAKVEKLPQPPKGDALIRGDAIHKMAERFVLDGGKVPTELSAVAVQLRQFRKLYEKQQVSLESEIAFDEQWRRVDYFTKEVFVRIKWDLIVLPESAKKPVRIVDYKTGKVREYGEYDDQLELYGVGALTLGLGEEAMGELLFTDHNVTIARKQGAVKLKDLAKLQKKWAQRAQPLLRDVRFSPRPGNHCRWCPWAKQKGGPCPY